jgi:AcrR family transcriptional regulator
VRSSGQQNERRSLPPDDRTTRARIRDCAIDVVANEGVSGLSARKVAEAAKVSPGLVIHHFGSMDALRAACDEHVAAVIRHQKSAALGAGPGLDLMATFRDAKVGALAGYLAAVLADNSASVSHLVDELVDNATEYAEQGVESGMLRPSGDARARAVVLTLWSLGGLVMHRHMQRLLGVDLTDPEVGSTAEIARYLAPAYEILGRGVLTDAFAASTERAVGDLASAREE